MPKENVELVRRVFDSVNRRDINGMLLEARPDIEVDMSESSAPYSAVHRGHEELRELFESVLEAWEELRWSPEEIIEVDNKRLIVVNHVTARGRGSGVAVDATRAQLWTVADGKATTMKLYQSKAEAVNALGLPGAPLASNE